MAILDQFVKMYLARDPLISEGWWLFIIVVITEILILAMIYNSKWSSEGVSISADRSEEHTQGISGDTKVSDKFEEDVGDDLRVFEGIGPKISHLFSNAGIITYNQLADTPVDRLQKILDEAYVRLGNPTPCPAQVSLSALEKWEQLKKLQDELKGGKRVKQ